MANWYTSHYWIEGKEDYLKSLAEHIGKEKTVAELFKEMGIPVEVDSYVNWFDPVLKDGVLELKESSKWEQSNYLWDLKEYSNGGIGNIYYFCAGIEDDIFTSNDQDGKYYPYRIVATLFENVPEDEGPHFYAISLDDITGFLSVQDFLEKCAKHGIMAASLDEAEEAAKKVGLNFVILKRVLVK